MKKIALFLGGVLAILLLGLVVLFFYDDYEWSLKSEKISPNGQWGMYQYLYMSDGIQHAPYGDYIFLHPEFKISKPYKSHVIFAGYCNELTYSWASDTQIDIICVGEGVEQIKTFSQKAYGLNINVQTK